MRPLSTHRSNQERIRRMRRSRTRCSRSSKLQVEMLEERRLLAADFIANEVLVQFEPDTTPETRAQIRPAGSVLAETIHTAMMQRSGSGVIEKITLASNMTVDQAVAYFSTQDGVLAAEPNYVFDIAAVSNDTLYTNGSLWGMYSDNPAITPGVPANTFGSQAEKAWNNNQLGSSNVYVGIIDTGIQWNHVDLVDNMWTNPFDPVDGVDNDNNGYIDDVHGWDFSNNDSSIFDNATDDSHGTHVAGTIGGTGGNAQGVAGVNWDVSMISLRIFYPFSMDQTVKAYDYLTDLKLRHGLDVVASSNSWRGYSYSAILHAAINRGAKADILMIGAAGNETINNDVNPPYPASLSTLNDAVDLTTGNVLETAADYDGVIAVASIQSDGAISGFSNYGATSVDIAAPGTGIFSTLPTNTYGSYDGTSMATPHVSGAAALYKSVYPTATAEEVKAALLDGARPTASLNGRVVTNGRLDVASSLAIAPLSKISVSDEAVIEGDSGTTEMIFTISLSKPSTNAITVDWATEEDTATADVDYLTEAGSLTFAPGELEKTISVTVVGDLDVELREQFKVVLSNPTNSIIRTPFGIGEIVSEDLPDITVEDVSIVEGNSGYKAVYFTVALSGLHSENVAISYATTDGTAKAGGDYQPESGLLVIPSGQRTGFVRVNIIGDNLIEDNESFYLRLFAAQQGTILDDAGIATIINDDSEQGLTIYDSATLEGNTGRKNMYFSVALAQPSKSFITIHYATVNGTATSADRDFVAVSGQVSIRPGATSATIAIPILGDRKAESDEMFSIQIVRAFGAVITDGLAVGTIINDDAGRVLPPPPPVGGPSSLGLTSSNWNQTLGQSLLPAQGSTPTLSPLMPSSPLRSLLGPQKTSSATMTDFLAMGTRIGPRNTDSFASSVDLALVALLKDGDRLAKLS
jgi:subtilisin family serine protease